MPVTIPDCLAINPEDTLVVWSRDESGQQHRVAGDYETCTIGNLHEEDPLRLVLLMVLPAGTHLPAFVNGLDALNLPAAKKRYLVLEMETRFTSWHVVKKWLQLSRMFPLGERHMSPTVFARGGGLVVNLSLWPRGYARYEHLPWRRVVKDQLRFWRQIWRAIHGAEFLLVEATACPN